jgi:hypothetical protein
VSTNPHRQIACDTGPLISLEKITGGYRFIGRLYDQAYRSASGHG